MHANQRPDFCLVVLIGPSGSGKTHVRARALHADRGDLVGRLPGAGQRRRDRPGAPPPTLSRCLRCGHCDSSAGEPLTVIDATNVRRRRAHRWSRSPGASRDLPVAIVLNLPEQPLPGAQSPTSGSALRAARRPPAGAAAPTVAAELKREGFRYVTCCAPRRRSRRCATRGSRSGPTVATSTARSTSSATSTGASTNLELLTRLGYGRGSRGTRPALLVAPPAGRRVVFVGDLVDRGPRIADVLRLAMDMIARARRCACREITRSKLPAGAPAGTRCKLTHGLAEPARSSKPGSRDSRPAWRGFSTAWLATMCSTTASSSSPTPGFARRCTGAPRARCAHFALYGETTGETDEFGLPVRYNWAAEYRGQGHGGVRPHAGARRRSGSTTRSASIPAACSAAS